MAFLVEKGIKFNCNKVEAKTKILEEVEIANRCKHISPDAPHSLQVLLHCVGDTEVVRSQRTKEMFIPATKQRGEIHRG